MLSGSEIEIHEIAELISNDSTFTARVLQRANSALYGQLNPVANLKQAVALLGFDQTRNIVLAQATAAYAQGALRTEELQRCWQHTIATAVLAEEIAKACSAFQQTAFTAGIMHDIGRLGLLVAYPDDYERIIRDASGRCLDLLDFENEEFGLDHAEAGRMLAERWQLPAEVCIVAGRHHDPCEGTELDLLRIVHVACRLADCLGFEVSRPLVPLELDAVLADLPGAARAKLSDRARLSAVVDRRISEYGNSRTAPPPEETLALLNAANADDPDQNAEGKEATIYFTPDEKSEGMSPMLIALIALAVFAVAAIAVLTQR
jgi:putative nucleotidyltransferase with HDIG domain